VDIGHFFITLDINKLMPLDMFISRLDHMVNEVKGSPKATGVEEIFIPGERRTNKFLERKREGIPVSQPVLDELNELALQFSVVPL